MINLSPTEIDRLLIFNAAQFARRNRDLGIKLSHPEAVALISDEVMLAARRNLPYAEIRDLAGRMLTTDDVEPGVSEMIPMLYIECMFAEGTKVVAVFDPISPGELPLQDHRKPGEIIHPRGDITSFQQLPHVEIDVMNTGDRDVQVRSHTHFFEVNRAMRFDRSATWGMKIDEPAGGGLRFEPGVSKTVRMIPIEGNRCVYGQAGLVNGSLDAPMAKETALKRARELGYLGA